MAQGLSAAPGRPATERLYRADPYRTIFEALTVESLAYEGHPAVILDATCFYPTSGGQPYDTGTLNGVAVVDVVEVGEQIVHVLGAPLEAGPVQGVIDWPRRFDHMQQHTGQHILSAAFEQVLQAATVSFHLGASSSTIDLDLAALEREAAEQVEELANRVVFANWPVSVREYNEQEITRVPLRKPPVVHGRIRVVEIGGAFDYSACGGTHVRMTGELGAIHIAGWERRRGQTRVEFLCGWRALRDYRAKDATCRALAGRMSVGVPELGQAVERLGQAEQAARHEAEALRKRLVVCELPQMVAEAEPIQGARVLCRFLEGYDVGNMRFMAQTLVQESGFVALLGVTDPAPQLCFARSADVGWDMARLLKEVLALYGGRGGGQPHLAQGGGLKAEDVAAALRQARERLGGG